MDNNNIRALLRNADIQQYSIPCAEKTLVAPRDYGVIDFIEESTVAMSMDDIHTLCVKIRKRYGFDYFSFYVYLPRPEHKPLCYFMRDYANDWTDYYARHNCLLVDPSLRYTLEGVTPMIWRLGTTLEIAQKAQIAKADKINAIWEPDANYRTLTSEELHVTNKAYESGMRDVTCFPINGIRGDHGVIRFVHEANGISPNNSARELIRITSQLSLLVHHVYEEMVRVLRTDSDGKKTTPSPLTPREYDVLCCAAAGKSTADIGKQLNVSENTVKTHLKRIYIKLCVKTRQHAIAKAVSLRFIQP